MFRLPDSAIRIGTASEAIGGCMNELTVKEFAALERVTEVTVRRWIAKGAIDVRRTAGGGIRIVDRRQNVVFLTIQSDHPVSNRSGDTHPVT